jgi:hypothetical protein
MPLDAVNGMFHADMDTGNPAVLRLFIGSEFTAARLLLALKDRGPFQRKALEAGILVKQTAFGQGEGRLIGDLLVVLLPGKGLLR